MNLENYDINLCNDCLDLAKYAIKRREFCPKDPKPACKKCSTPCYAPKYKEKIRKVMRFSGMYYIKKDDLIIFTNIFVNSIYLIEDRYFFILGFKPP